MRALALVLLVSSASSQSLLFWHVERHQLVAVPAAGSSAEQLVRGLLVAPASSKLTTALPPGTTVVATAANGTRAVVTFNARFLAARALGTLEDAIEQVTKTLHTAGFTGVSLQVRTERGVLPLREALGEEPSTKTALPHDAGFLPTVAGALTGRTIAISAGHGYYWHSTLGWTTQRGNIGGLTEDIHTNEICMQVLIPMLLNMGARVVACRERGEITREGFADNDQGAPRYSETGLWSTSASMGYGGLSYRFATTGFTPTATATWDLVVPAEGNYPVYVFYRAGTNRAFDARFAVHHTGGVTVVPVDQTTDNVTWVYLGTFRFTPARGARVVLDNQSTLAGRVVIADAVRIGGGLGSIARGSGTSNRPRWQEASRYWAQFAGAPASVYDSISGGEDNDDDVTARPRFAEWVGGCDAFLSLHTNAGGGLGTSTYIYDGGATPGSAALQTAVHNQIVADVRAHYDPAWTDRGRLSANFGEVRLLSTMPGILVELAFHDVAGSRDHEALRDADFRSIAGRAMARGILRYFAPAAPFPPEPPAAFRVQQDGQGGLTLAWDAAAGATMYSIELSPDGKGFVEAAQTSATAWNTAVLPHDSVLSFRVRAHNSSGRSEPTDVLSAGTSHTRRAECLLVHGFDRRDKVVRHLENTKDYLRLHADAIARAGEFSLGFDAATNEAVVLGRVNLGPYRVVDWACGEESTEDETFSNVEQALVSAYLAAGGRLLVTGAEIGWDLDARGTTTDRAFYNGALGARFVSDDAGTYGFGPVAGGIFAGLPSGAFDNGTGLTYDVDFPDTLSPADARSTLCLAYTGGAGAGIQRTDNDTRVVNLGFPLETITDPNLRAAMMARALRFLLAPRALEVPATTPLGTLSAVTLHVPQAPNKPYLLATALSTVPGLPLPGGHILPLNADGVFGLSLTPGNGVFVGFFGTLDAQGDAQAGIVLPVLPVLVGLPLFTSGFVLPNLSGLAVEVMLPWVRTVGR
jgi:N-acetylmuramoyl-L-alanine amidase